MPRLYSNCLHYLRAGCLRHLRGILLTVFFVRRQGLWTDNGVYEDYDPYSR